MAKKKHYDLTIINATCVVALILCIGFVLGFAHGRDPWHWEGYILDTEVVGQYGDFIGGFVGTFLSVILLYYTFYHQRKDSSKNSKVYKKQQLNDDFYHLISLYQDVLKSLSYKTGDEDIPLLTGKEALHVYLDNLRDGFDENSTGLLRKQAVLAYMGFYALNRDFAPIYYRTLYRLCETIIGQEEGTECKNVELIKILRTQLSDTELVMMRYNAQTRMGKPFQIYANRFNLLKHLPTLDLLEYKKYRKVLGKEEDIYALNIILVQIRQRMGDILDAKGVNYITLNEFRSAVSVVLSVSNNKDFLKLVIKREKNSILHSYDPFNCIMKLPGETLSALFSDFLYDCVVLHNFQQYNNRRELDFGKENKEIDNKEQYIFSVQNKAHRAINMTWNQFDTRSEKERWLLVL